MTRPVRRVVCSNPWTARFAVAVFTVNERGVVLSFVFVHDVEQPIPPRPSVHRLFG